MRNSILEIFKLEDLRSPWTSRLLFLLLLLIRSFPILAPIGDTDFTAFYDWAETMLNDTEKMANATVADIPLTKGNLLFLGISFASLFLCVMASTIYSGIYIREYRMGKEDNKLPIIKTGNMFGRLFLMTLLLAVISVPAAAVSVFFIFVMVMAVPCIIMYPSCYLSGDSGIFGAAKDMIYRTRGYYLTNAKNICIILLLNWILGFIPTLIEQVSEPAAMITESFIFVFILLALARYAGIIYCRLLEHPYVPEPVGTPDNDIPDNYRD